MAFEWAENKNAINIRKHGVSFNEAVSAFYDDYAVLFDDPDRSADEERFLLIGFSNSSKLIIVSHCYKEREDVIRIISARQATNKETTFYVLCGGEI